MFKAILRTITNIQTRQVVLTGIDAPHAPRKRLVMHAHAMETLEEIEVAWLVS